MNIRTYAALALGVAAASASAQIDVTKPGYAKLGIGFPISSTVRDDVSKTAWTLGLGYDLPKPLIASALPGRTSVELGYARLNGNGTTIDDYRLQLIHRISLSQPLEGKGAPYAGIGIGLRYARLDGKIGNFNGSDNQTQFAATGLLGYDISSRLFVEAAYNFAPTIDDVHTDILSLSLGVRF